MKKPAMKKPTKASLVAAAGRQKIIDELIDDLKRGVGETESVHIEIEKLSDLLTKINTKFQKVSVRRRVSTDDVYNHEGSTVEKYCVTIVNCCTNLTKSQSASVWLRYQRQSQKDTISIEYLLPYRVFFHRRTDPQRGECLQRQDAR